MRLLRSFAILCAVASGVGLLPHAAIAQRNPWIAEARRLGEEADFEAALQAFERAQREGGLSRPDVVELFAQRSVIHYALRDEPRMRLDLERLAALEPEYRFGAEVLPQVRTSFDRLRLEVEPLTLELWVRKEGEQLEISAQYGRPPPQLVLEDRVYVRVRGQPWRSAAARIAIANPERQPVEYYAEAFGPGGALLVARGSREQPLRFFYEGPAAAQATAGNSTTLWWVLGGSALLLAGATVLIAAMVSENDHTQFEGPVVR
jgi:hypothetical protein